MPTIKYVLTHYAGASILETPDKALVTTTGIKKEKASA